MAGARPAAIPSIPARSAAAALLAVLALSRAPSRSEALTMSSSSSSSSSRRPPRNIVVVGGGIQGTSVAYHLSQSRHLPPNSKITLLEAKGPASAASGKGGGFMARSWGDGGPTQTLHHLAFDMYAELAPELGCATYRTLPVLSVRPGRDKGGAERARKDSRLRPVVPGWLDGNVGPIRAMGFGDDTAQITPDEFVGKMLERAGDAIEVRLGACTGVETEQGSERGSRKIIGVKYAPRADGGGEAEEEATISADAVIVSAGPWSCAAEDWFQGAVELPMEGIKSTSIVWKKPEGAESVDATALFCGEDNRFGTHLEVYPRPDGSIYICGIGGSDYITKEELKSGAFREVCEANEARVSAASDSFREMSSTYSEKGELDKVQACMRPCPPDAMPYMGAVPGFEGAYINAGHNCWGIAWAPACGRAMSELVLEGESTSVDLRPFSPSRFTPANKRGGRGRKKRGASVGEQW